MLGYGTFMRAMLVVIGCAVVGCEADEQPPPRAPRTFEARSDIGILVVASRPNSEQLKVAVEHALVRGGHRVVATADEPHELVAQLDVSVAEKQSILTVYVDGQPKKNYAAHASISLLGQKQILDVQTLDYDVDDGPSEESLAAFIGAVGGKAVASYVAAQKKKRQNEATAAEAARLDEEDRREEAQLAKKRAVKRQEEEAWSQVVLSDCTSPTRVDGCEAAKQFLTRFPDGKHASETRKAVETGSVLVAKLADDRDWGASNGDACREPQTSTDCDGVSNYVNTHPAGVHLEEAQAVLARTQKRRAQLAQAEAQKAEKDAARAEQAEKAAERAQCKKDCIGNMCFNLRPGTFEICMDRCVKANCD